MSRAATRVMLLLYAASGTAGDVLLSHGMKHTAVPFVLVAVCFFALAYGVFLGLLRKLPCSLVVPAQASTYGVTVAASYLLLHEAVPVLRWTGTMLVCTGVAIVLLSGFEATGAESSR